MATLKDHFDNKYKPTESAEAQRRAGLSKEQRAHEATDRLHKELVEFNQRSGGNSSSEALRREAAAVAERSLRKDQERK